MRSTTTRALAALCTIGLVAAGCGGDDDEAATTTAAAEPPATTASTSADASTPAPSAGLDLDAVLAADLASCAAEPSGEPIVVGMALDYGEVSGYADIPGGKAAQYLAELINCTGGVDGAPVQVEVRDIQGDPQVTATATQELVDAGADFLIGPPFADFGQPVLQVANGEVPVIFAAATEPSLPNAAGNSFLATFDDTAQATAAAEWALENGYTRAITFSSPGPYFGYNPEVFTDVFTAGGGEVILDETYVPVEDTDFSSQVNEIAGVADGTEVVYSAMLAFQVTALRGQLEAQGLTDLTYIGSDAFEATGIVFEENNEGIYHTTHGFREPGGRLDTFIKGYEAAKGEELESGTFAGLYADAMLIGIQGMLDCGCSDGVQIGQAIAQIESFQGFSDALSYAGTNGTPVKPVSIHRVVGGEDTLIASWGE